MKHGARLAGLVLALCGPSQALFGQDSPWRPASAPEPVAPSALAALRPCPAVTLGKPVCLPAASAPALPLAIRPASYTEPATEAHAPADDSGWTDAGDDKGTDFATERALPTPTVPIATTVPAAVGGLRLVGLTDGTAKAPGYLPPSAEVNSPAGPLVATGPDDVSEPRYFFSAEYLFLWLKQDKVPVLATTSSNPFDNGILGRPTTQVLFGGDGIDGSGRSGFRLTAGYWLDDNCSDAAVEVRGFYLSPRSTNFDANSSQFPVIARPFFDVNMNKEFSQLTAFPGVLTGNLNIRNQSELWGAEANGLCNVCCGCNYRLDFFGGFRYLELQESLNITENGVFLAGEGPPLAGDRFFVNDFFQTRNQFFGGQVGLSGGYDWGPFSVGARGQVAIGDTHQDILIDGSQVITAPNGTTQTFRGGLLALSSNIGRYHRDRFSVVPELDLNVGYALTEHVRLFVGYDALYWNNVVRPGGQIDRNIDVTLIPNFPVAGAKPTGLNVPSAPRNSTDLWAQGITAGVEIRY